MLTAGQIDDLQGCQWEEQLIKSTFLGSDDAVCLESGTEKVQSVLHVSLAFSLYAKKDAGIADCIISLFCDRGIEVKLLKSSLSLQLVSEQSRYRRLLF